jgi:DNA-binding NarL/FixJ family response regulator
MALRLASLREATNVLTPRELEILRLVGRGLSTKEMASMLFVAEGTVKVHLHHMFRKVHVHGRQMLAQYARHIGFA